MESGSWGCLKLAECILQQECMLRTVAVTSHIVVIVVAEKAGGNNLVLFGSLSFDATIIWFASER